MLLADPGFAGAKPMGNNTRWPASTVGLTTQAEQFEQVVSGADERPFRPDLRQAPQQELPEAAAPLDLAEDRLDGLHAQGVTLAASLGLQLAPHPVAGAQTTGYASPGDGGGTLPRRACSGATQGSTPNP